MKKVLVNKPIHEAALKRLEEEVEVIKGFQADYQELVDLLPEVNGVILCAGLNMGSEEMDLAGNLEVIGRHGAGVDIVDIQAATDRGIPVTFTPYGPTESTAEHALMLMLAVARRLPLLDRAVRNGNFQIRDQVVGQELEGKKLGIVGFGRIGRRLAEICQTGLHMELFFYDPFLGPEAEDQYHAVRVKDIVELARKVDVLSIHSPFTEKTRKLVNRDAIMALGESSILINTSRGPVVDEEALIEALESGALGGAGLDVYSSEPPDLENPLFKMDQVALTPHLASFTDEGRQRMGLMAVNELLCVLRGEKPENIANPEVWERRTNS